tara:strand:- start:1658 stop:2062 length:405 start_codon:yes stop_codon:yes gene_type:complete
MKTFTQLLDELSEEMAVNFASGGGISGMGYNIGKADQPQVAGRDADDLAIKPRKKKKVQETFAGCPVFTVTSEEYSKCLNGRTKYERWSKKMNMEDMNNQEIRSYAHRNPAAAIIIKDEKSGVMSYLIPPTKEN